MAKIHWALIIIVGLSTFNNYLFPCFAIKYKRNMPMYIYYYMGQWFSKIQTFRCADKYFIICADKFYFFFGWYALLANNVIPKERLAGTLTYNRW